jgi:hypothetical protein
MAAQATQFWLSGCLGPSFSKLTAGSVEVITLLAIALRCHQGCARHLALRPSLGCFRVTMTITCK